MRRCSSNRGRLHHLQRGARAVSSASQTGFRMASVSDQDEREELFFAVLANPALLDDCPEAA